MKVFKFGGASVKDAQGVKNVAHILSLYPQEELVIVVSAMGKITNRLEEVLQAYRAQGDYKTLLKEIEDYHLDIVQDLMPSHLKIKAEIGEVFANLQLFFDKNKSPQYDFVYDQVVSKGEFLSTKIVSAYLNQIGIENTWLDARDYIKTDNTYREGKVKWEETCHRFQQLDTSQLYITQGFIGSNDNRFTITLGREGSDYSGAIIAHCLNAKSLTIWKDVAGVLNADPRYFNNTIKLNHISYGEAIELTFYGASVIHPKTLQPLENKSIPLFVKSFENPQLEGTCIEPGVALEPVTPCYIVKNNQHVLHISTKNFEFIDEHVIRDVFNKLAANQLKVNLMQISAISLSLCIEDKFNKLELALEDLQKAFIIEHLNNCILFTVRHFTDDYLNMIPEASKPLIKQIRETTLQIVVKSQL